MVPTGAAAAQGAFAGSASQTKAGMPIGPFGGMAHLMSPAASPPQSTTPVPPAQGGGGPAPSGSTPNAKRPMDRAAVDVVTGGSRSMSIEDLSAGFVSLENWGVLNACSSCSGGNFVCVFLKICCERTVA